MAETQSVTAATPEQNAARRAQLANMAVNGSAAAPPAVDNRSAVPPAGPAAPAGAPGSRQAAVAAAAGRAAQINAPAALVAGQAGAVGAAFDQAAATRSRNDGAYGALAGAYSANTGGYLAQLEAARPILDARTALAVRQIMAERQSRAAEDRYRRDALSLDRDKLSLEREQFDAERTKGKPAEPLSVAQAGKAAGIKNTKAIVAQPGYEEGRQIILELAANGATRDQMEGNLRSYLASPLYGDDGTVLLGPGSEEAIELLIAQYGPALASDQERTEDAQRAAVQPQLDAVGAALRRLNPLAGRTPQQRLSETFARRDRDSSGPVVRRP